jgi:hypothetical protein
MVMSDEENNALHCLGMCVDWADHPAYQGEEHACLRQFLLDCGDGLSWQKAEIERLRAERDAYKRDAYAAADAEQLERSIAEAEVVTARLEAAAAMRERVARAASAAATVLARNAAIGTTATTPTQGERVAQEIAAAIRALPLPILEHKS